MDSEGGEYHSCAFTLGERRVLFRAAKITPRKDGQFVTLWRRSSRGVTEPFGGDCGYDLVIISVQKDKQVGQFVFSKSVMIEQGIFSSVKTGGKRGFRVYPPWDRTTSKQATLTKKWQSAFFIALPEESAASIDKSLAAKLFY
ncbi:hypothetical protein PSACC_03174 [Paramicrosporidium saccamoebae]|uniref:MepB protein n=1 Tax=Paramicrosporidium saccamoebae TaxID=1246581 RepID=A0A2H9TGZ2_9FUNG|nr:hypothetical protein PSACC_03174 [Paramicrosporidium saccamoebae]